MVRYRSFKGIEIFSANSSILVLYGKQNGANCILPYPLLSVFFFIDLGNVSEPRYLEV